MDPDHPCDPDEDTMSTETVAHADEIAWFGETFTTIVDAVGAALVGKERVVQLAVTCLAAGGHLLIEDVPGTGKTSLARSLAGRRPGQPPAHPVHPRPAALRRHRGLDLRPAPAGLRVPPRPGLREHRPRRRDQPGLAEDPVGAPRGHGGGAGHRRRRHARRADAVHGHRHPEPHRAGRDLPAPRGPARPLPHEDGHRLPRRGGDDRAAVRARRARPGRRRRERHRRRAGPPAA